MTLEATVPTKTDKRLKLMIYGPSGVGKTYAALRFPKPYVIDTERGTEHDEYVDALIENGGVRLQTSSMDKIIEQVRELINTSHDYKTLVIDPVTQAYHQEVELAEKAMKSADAFGRAYNEANKKMKRLISLVYALDMNVIFTSHAKDVYAPGTNVISGQTFDAYKKLDHAFDLVISVTRKKNKPPMAIVTKSRIKTFPLGEEFEFSFEAVAERYSLSSLTKKSETSKLVNEKTLTTLQSQILLKKIPEEEVESWLANAKVSALADLTEVQAQKCINYITTEYTK
jgi:phosphoribosyl-ATP pyrophosphohydrolase